MSSTGRWRTPLMVACLILLTVAAPAAIVAHWLDDLVSDTDTYVETVAPLADDPDVQEAVARRVSTALTKRLQVQAITEDAAAALADRGLPARLADSLSALGDPLAESVDDYVHDHVLALVRSPEFSDAWERANREAHAQLDVVLTGGADGAVEVEDNVVRLDLALVVDAVKARLADAGFSLVERLPEVTAEFTVMETADLQRVQSVARLLVVADRLLPVVALLFAVGAVVAARNRRRAAGAVGWVLTGSMLVLGIGVQVARGVYLGELPPEASPEAAAAIFDQVVSFVRRAFRSLVVLGLVIGVAAWAGGPGAVPSGVRRRCATRWTTFRDGRNRAATADKSSSPPRDTA